MAIVGILITAALFLDMLRRLFFGHLPASLGTFKDLSRAEWLVLGVLSLGIVTIGVYPSFVLTLLEAASGALVGGR